MKKSSPQSMPKMSKKLRHLSKNPKPTFAQDKAYKLLAKEKNMSNNLAKSLIDKGLVTCNGKRILIARSLLKTSSHFEVHKVQKPRVIFENEQILAIDKPALIESYEICKMFDSWSLLHRLDRETSGVMLLVREGSDFHLAAKKAFLHEQVYKAYYCVVHGIVAESMNINAPILTRKGKFAKSRIDKNGKSAFTQITPLRLEGKNTHLQVVIKTGRTHQIRLHLQHIAHPILGDRIYGKDDSAPRLMLHAHKIALLGYEFISPVPF